ncbi:efflux RND transporter periplasmic adaptor subunit [Notoacmeibacter marinus]|uniref:efflux RND transporter periplasmic adaptor subunit n=1 Tax=Notoacmeibacter marinus TaxID=1876515 RepID=UPI0013B06858|nr:HlyD family efflux transporter periplasmic adaptor subunit [Notoacmeibacter marinus]
MNRPSPSSNFAIDDQTTSCGEASPAAIAASLPQGRPLPSSRLAELLRFEGLLREAQSDDQLGITITTALNSKLLPGLQRALLFGRERSDKFRLQHASYVTRPDRDSLPMQRLERAVCSQARSLSEIAVLAADELLAARSDDDAHCQARSLICPFVALLPLVDRRPSGRGKAGEASLIGVLLLEFDRAPGSHDPILQRIAGACGHALSLFGKTPSVFASIRLSRLATSGLIAIVLLGVIPVPLSALAPAEIVAADPFIVAAPIDGIIRTVNVAPNSLVAKDDLLFTYDDTELAGRQAIAREALAVAAAREQRLRQAAFSDPAARRELAEADALRRVAEAEFRQAEGRLSRTQVRAAQEGIALFARPDQWIGKPVSTGERIMEIADPDSMRLRAELPIGDAGLLANRQPLRLFLEGRPFDPVGGRIVSAGYRAEVTPDNRLAYILTGELNETDALRIGMRGTVQIMGDRVSLAYYLFRRPIAALRQRFGR